MAGLPCTVLAVFAFALLGTVTKSAFVCQTPVSPKVSQTPEKCMNKVETGSEMSNEERQSAVDAINTYRAFIANQCEFRFEKPKSANFLKIRYACDMEAYVKFDCPLYGTDFGPVNRTFRTTFEVKEYSVFFNIAPPINEIDFNQNQKFRSFHSPDELFHGAEVLLFYLNNEAEIGCYKKTCHSRAYIQCTTYTDMKNPLRKLYIAGSRCQSNVDCKDPGHPICDMEYGLCEQGNLPYRCGQHKEPEVRLKSEMCLDRLETGSRMSNAERQLVVDGINLHRGFITNQCDEWGSGAPASANMLKVHYNCELEKQVKFECPEAGPENWKSDDMVFRQISALKLTVSRTSIMWRLKPTMSDVKIDANTQTLENATLKGSEFLSFALNNNVSEVGCFLKECHRQEYIACTTGHPFDVTKPLYTRGNRCQKNADCNVAGYHICNMEFGLCDKGGCRKDADCTDAASPVCYLESSLCGPLTCKFSDDKLTVDACKDLRACTEATDKAEPEKQFCRSTIIIATRNDDNSFTVKGFGAAMSEKYLLTTEMRDWNYPETPDLYVIVGGTLVYQIRSADVTPRFHMNYETEDNSWQNLYLVELPANSTFKFNDYLNVKSVGPNPQDKSLTFRMGADKINIEEIVRLSDAECQKIWVKKIYISCGLDDIPMDDDYLRGVPLADVALTNGKHTLHGIREVSKYKNRTNFLVTKLALHCDWLFDSSEGAVKCI